MIDCEEFQEAMTMPIGPTNTFVLVRKSDVNPLSTFFIPKPQYTFPVQTSHFHIQLDHNKDIQTSCTCSSAVKVFHDQKNEYITDNEKLNSFNKSNSCESSTSSSSYQWYQARKVIKGFKYFR